MSGKRGPRECLEPNIYRDRYGLSFKVQVGVWTREARFPPGYPITDIRKRVVQARAELLDLPGADASEAAQRGTLEADADRFEQRKHHLASWVGLRSEVRAWVALYGPWQRWRIKRQHVLDARDYWLKQHVAPKTINNRVATLANLFRELDGCRAPTPCDDLRPLDVERTSARLIPRETVLAVYNRLVEWEKSRRLRDRKARARFMVYASSGRRPSEIVRARPEDLDFTRRIWIVRDGKGGFTPGGLYLHDDLLAAWQLFVAADAWGYFREGSFVRTLRAAGWPAGVRPYQLRHSVGIALSEAGHDLADVGAWLGHTRQETTREHYVPVLGSRMQAAGETLGQRIGWPQDDDAGQPPVAAATPSVA